MIPPPPPPRAPTHSLADWQSLSQADRLEVIYAELKRLDNGNEGLAAQAQEILRRVKAQSTGTALGAAVGAALAILLSGLFH